MEKQMLVPGSWRGPISQVPRFPGYEWLKQLSNKKIFCALFQGWPDQDLPVGYDNYLVSFHLEAVDIDWLKRQKVNGPIFVLFDGNHYDLKIPGVYFVPFYFWHIQLKTMQEWFGTQKKHEPTYKFSAVCNRITQSKTWITTKLLEVASQSSLIVLNSWLQEKNVHNWIPTSNSTLNNLTDIFKEKYLGQEIKIDNFDNDSQNQQSVTGNPWQPLYQDCVINFTNESFHYSHMMENNNSYIWPGPFLTEKTFKCLLGATTFIPVGQFETYKTLQSLGFQFDYGFDVTWDLESGNLTRFDAIVNLIDTLNQLDVKTLKSLTQDCNDFNQNHVTSGQFFKVCQNLNNESIESILKNLT